MVEVDARGFSCPVPVVKTKKAIEANPGQPITVLVESDVSRENVTRLAESKGYSLEVENTDDGFKLHLNPEDK